MLYLSIILLSWLVCCVTGRPLPCTMVDDKQGKGKMLCCDYQPLSHEGLSGIKAQQNQVLQSDKKCTLMTPKTSLGLMKEVWSMRNYTWAAGMLTTKLPNIPRHKGCCCEEQFVFSISNKGISAKTGKTHKIFQQDQYVQPVLSLLCVKNDDCHISGNMKVFQRMEAHSYYIESEDHPEYVHEELLLKPSGCLCVPETQTVKADIGEILIPMNLIEQAMTDTRIVKRNVEYHTELPEILHLALEIMREPNPLPVLDSIERQMALQLQQTRYFAAMAMASGLGGGGFGPDYRNTYQQNQQGNETKADMESLKKYPLHSYQLILSAFLSGLALGQNFQNISQVEILDRLIVDNGNSGINLLETILELQNHSHGLDYNSLEFGVNSSITTYSTSAALADSSTETSINIPEEGVDVIPSAALADSTTDAASIVQTSSQKVGFLSNDSSIDSTSDSSLSSSSYEEYTTSDSIAGISMIFSEDMTPNASALVDSKDSTADTVVYSSSGKEYTTPVADSHVYFEEKTSTNAPAVFGDDTDHGSSNNNYSTHAAPMIGNFAGGSTYPNEDSMIFNEEITPNAAALADSTDTTTDTIFYTSSGEEYTTPVADSHVYFDEETLTKAPTVFDDSSSNEDYSTHAAAPHMIGNFEGSGYTYPDENFTTYVPALTDGEVQHASSDDYYTIDSAKMVDSTTGPVDHTSFNEDYTTDAADIVGRTEESDNIVWYSNPEENFSTHVPAVTDGEVKHASSNDYYTIDSAKLVDSTTGPVDHTSFNEDNTTDAADIVDRTEESDNIVWYSDPDENFSTHVPAVTDGEVQHASSNDYFTIDSAKLVDSTTGPVDHTSFNEDYTTDAADIVDRTEESDNIVYNEDVTNADTMIGSTAEPYIQTSYNNDSITNAAELFGSTTEPTAIFYSEDTSTDSTLEDSTTESGVHNYNDADTTVEIKEPGVTTSHDEYVTTSNISTESDIPGSKFNLHEYIMGLPQFQPLTIDTELLMHIMFPPEPITHDERNA